MVVTWRAGGEELCQQDAGEAADEDPVGVEPGQRHLRQGDQYYPYRDTDTVLIYMLPSQMCPSCSVWLDITAVIAKIIIIASTEKRNQEHHIY